jgi:hypothetical protein
VRWHSKSVRIFAGAGFFWFLIMVTLTLSDYLSRGAIIKIPLPQVASL